MGVVGEGGYLIAYIYLPFQGRRIWGGESRIANVVNVL